MSRIYTVTFTGTITNANGNVDWIAIKPAANKPIRLRGLILSQFSEVGDAQEEGLQFSILRLAATVSDGTGGAAGTIESMDGNDAAAGFTARVGDTGVTTTSGGTDTLDIVGWNIRGTPFERWWPDPAFAPRSQNAEALVVRQDTTVADDVSVTATFYIEEY